MVCDEFRKGNRRVVAVMPTGAGKTWSTVPFAEAHLGKKPDGCVLFCAHREELIAQAYDTFVAAGLSCGVIQSTPTREVNPHRPIQIASTQTLLARGLFPNATFLVLDEVHHYASEKWSSLAQEYARRGVYILGLTATPVRGDGRPLGDLFDSLVVPVTIKELISTGHLVSFELQRPERKLRNDQIAARPVDAYLAYAKGRRAICFAGNIKAAEEFVCQFRQAGVRADLVTGDMDSGKRRSTLQRFSAGEIDVLCNVGVLTEGFDDRPTSCVIIARSIGPVSLYLQICGRALRAAPEVGKRDAIILDLHGCSWKHGSPDEDREYSLEGEGIRRKNLVRGPERFCGVCGALLLGEESLICERCVGEGVERPELRAPDVVNAKLVRYAAKRRETPEQREAYFHKLVAEAVRLGHSVWRPVKKFEAIYGERPDREWMRAAGLPV